MKRFATQFLLDWLDNSSRKPLVIRGARQVGKTWLVRQLAELRNLKLIEFNFENRPDLISIFASNNPHEIVENIEAKTNETLKLDSSLLFLDEIQAAPELLAKLRWFAEELPELPVISAGSLLEFVLGDHEFSMPVGRINYMYLEPLSFEEFLHANKKDKLYEYLTQYVWNKLIPEIIHHDLLNQFKEYTLVGGMPQAVKTWTETRSMIKVQQVHHDLLTTYRDDFGKYAARIDSNILNDVMQAIPRMLGKKFVYSAVNQDMQIPPIKKALKLLCKARVAHPVFGSAANGVPLGSETKEKNFKIILLDTGLASALLGLSLSQIKDLEDLNLVNQGNISEQIIGQLLRSIEPYYIEPSLHYWTREEKGSAAEIDYITQHNNQLIPIEVKSGSTGTLKSLHLFMHLKKPKYAMRINSDLPSITPIELKIHSSEQVSYTLCSLPMYLTGQLHRLLDKI